MNVIGLINHCLELGLYFCNVYIYILYISVFFISEGFVMKVSVVISLVLKNICHNPVSDSNFVNIRYVSTS